MLSPMTRYGNPESFGRKNLNLETLNRPIPPTDPVQVVFPAIRVTFRGPLASRSARCSVRRYVIPRRDPRVGVRRAGLEARRVADATGSSDGPGRSFAFRFEAAARVGATEHSSDLAILTAQEPSERCTRPPGIGLLASTPRLTSARDRSGRRREPQQPDHQRRAGNSGVAPESPE
jgi:hypothetical protein